MKLSLTSNLTMNNGQEIPVLGLGTYQMHESAEAKPAVLEALKVGYKHIDTAQMYDNEAAVGEAVTESGVERSDVFLTTKIYAVDMDQPRAHIKEALKNLQTDCLDLYLIHYPIPVRNELWKEMAAMQKEGLVRSIGVSNFTIRHLEELIDKTGIVPQVNQVELSIFNAQPELVEFCRKRGIVVEAYSPLTRGHKLDDPTVEEIAKKYGKTTAQVMIRWCLQQGLVVLPKSTKEKRIAENADVFDFDLDEEDLKTLATLDKGLRYCWDPTDAP